MIATEQTKWLTEGEMASNGQVQGVIAAGVQASPDDKVEADIDYILFKTRPDQAILRMGVLIRNPTEESGLLNLGIHYPGFVLSDIPTEVSGITEIPIADLPTVGEEVDVWFRVSGVGGGSPNASVLATLEFYVWAVVADISNPANVYTTIMTPAP